MIFLCFMFMLKIVLGGAAVAQWIRLRLPSCRPGFKSQAHHLRFFQFKFEIEHVEKTKINRKRGRVWPIFKKNCFRISTDRLNETQINKSRAARVERTRKGGNRSSVCFCQIKVSRTNGFATMSYLPHLSRDQFGPNFREMG